MMYVEFLEEKLESEDILSFTFEIRALPEPDQRSSLIIDRTVNALLDIYGQNENFAVDIEVVGANPSRQTLVLEVRVKGEQLTHPVISDVISKSLSNIE